MKWLLAFVGAALGACLLVSAKSEPQGWHALAVYKTEYEGRSGAQRHNARLAAQLINGVELAPGESLSLVECLGAWSKDRGYVKAPVAYNGNMIPAYGGGVCQTSTTVYNAALLAGFEIEERHRHHHMPTYIAPGRDAAIAFPNLDLRFRNPYDFSVRVSADGSGSGVTVLLEGRKPLPVSVEVANDVHDALRPASMELGSGQSRALRNPGKMGFEVSVYRYLDGEREHVSTDYYPPIHRVLERG